MFINYKSLHPYCNLNGGIVYKHGPDTHEFITQTVEL